MAYEELIYMDNAASTKLDERVLEAMKPYFFDVYAVATSEFGYSIGIEAKEALETARETIANRIGAKADELVFTSGATESNNAAIKGVLRALRDGGRDGGHIIVSAIEDFSVLNSAKALEKAGYDVTLLEVDEFGRVLPETLKKALRDETVLVSIQHANQEIGTLNDIASIGEILKARGIIFHSDATHSFARVPIDLASLPVDLLTISAHTIHGPRGIGGLYIREGTPFKKFTDGGFQENDRRPGLENIPGAVGFARAVELATVEETERLKKLRDRLFTALNEKIDHITINGHPTQRTPQNANVTFHWVEGESITLHLDMRGIAVSTGSACFSRSLSASHVILGIGGDHERAHGSVRFSLGRFNTVAEVDKVAAEIADVVERLRSISPIAKRNRENN